MTIEKKTVKKILLAIKIAITIAFVVVVNRTVSFAEFKQVHWSVLVSALLFSVAMQLLMVARWQMALAYFGKPVRFVQALSSYVAGSVFAVVTPGRAGELFRGATLTGIHPMASTSAVLFERVLAILALFPFGAAALLRVPEGYGSNFSGEYEWLYTLFTRGTALLAVVAMVLFVAAPLALPKLVRRFAGNGRYLIAMLLLSFAIHLLLLLQTATLFTASEVAGFSEALLVGALSFCAMQFMPISVANMGIRELWFGLFAGPFLLLSPEEAKPAILQISLIIMVVNLVLPALPGLFVLFANYIEKREFKKDKAISKK